MTDSPDHVIATSLHSFAARLQDSAWTGQREHEIKSLYAFGHLVAECRPGTFLHDPAQIALDSAVPQIPPDAQQALSHGTGRPKRAVAKDLIIWPAPGMTSWVGGASAVAPAVVMEWKLNRSGVFGYDVDWLTRFTALHPGVTGYAVTVDLRPRGPLLTCARVVQGAADATWGKRLL